MSAPRITDLIAAMGRILGVSPAGYDAWRAAALAAVAAALNARPRKTLGWRTPAEAFDEVLRSAHAGVATTH